MKAAPKHLSTEARLLWKKIAGTYSDFDEYAFLILRTAMESWDRLQDARRTLDLEGVFYQSESGLKKEHPCVKVEKQSRDGFLSAIRLLGLNLVEPGDVGRPPGT